MTDRRRRDERVRENEEYRMESRTKCDFGERKSSLQSNERSIRFVLVCSFLYRCNPD